MSSTAHDLIRNSARDVIAVYNCLFSSCRQRFASDSVSVRRHSDQHTGLQQLYRVLTSQQRERDMVSFRSAHGSSTAVQCADVTTESETWCQSDQRYATFSNSYG